MTLPAGCIYSDCIYTGSCTHACRHRARTERPDTSRRPRAGFPRPLMPLPGREAVDPTLRRRRAV